MTDYSMEKLTDNIFVCASSEHRFGTDAFLLTYFSNYRMKDKVCDLGTGCGIIPMIMQKKKSPSDYIRSRYSGKCNRTAQKRYRGKQCKKYCSRTCRFKNPVG